MTKIQVNADELKHMSPEEIVKAQEEGRLRAILGDKTATESV